MRRQIIIDTDPGQDDAIAIMLALASQDELEICGIVAVAGNVVLNDAVRNARSVCSLADPANESQVRVFAGCSKPLERDLVPSGGFHGKRGLDGPTLPEPGVPLGTQGGVDFLIEALRSPPQGGMTLCALGPLTNIATAFRQDPTIVEGVRELIMMGGAFSAGGNVTPTAEFNIHVDPEAAKLALKALAAAGVRVTMMPLDVTHQVLTTQAHISSLRAAGNTCGKAAADILAATGYDPRKYGWLGAPLHDPCVIAYLLQPELFRRRKVNVEIATLDPLTIGMTVVDWWAVTGRKPNAHFVNGVDAEAFFELLIERISRLP